jgi:hypothetical protein
MAEVIHDADGDHTTIQTTEARQGRWGRPVFWVLVVSTLLAALVLFISWGMRSGDLAAADSKEANGAAPSVQQQAPSPAADPGPTYSAP